MIQDATHVWSNRGRNDGVFTTAPKFVMNAWLPHSRHVGREPLRGLHPRVGHQDPQGAEMRPEHDQEGCQEPHPGPEPIAAEQHQAEEPALQGEREHALGGQQAPEHVADEPGVLRPVHPERELLDEPGRDAHREHQPVDLHPEDGGLPPDGVPGADVLPGHPDQEDPEPHRDGREDEVEARRQGELESRQEFGVHTRRPSPSTGPAPSSALASHRLMHRGASHQQDDSLDAVAQASAAAEAIRASSSLRCDVRRRTSP